MADLVQIPGAHAVGTHIHTCPVMGVGYIITFGRALTGDERDIVTDALSTLSDHLRVVPAVEPETLDLCTRMIAGNTQADRDAVVLMEVRSLRGPKEAELLRQIKAIFSPKVPYTASALGEYTPFGEDGGSLEMIIIDDVTGDELERLFVAINELSFVPSVRRQGRRFEIRLTHNVVMTTKVNEALEELGLFLELPIGVERA